MPPRTVGRITRRAAFAELQRSRVRGASGPVRVTFLPVAAGDDDGVFPQVAYAIGRHCGGAVVRNSLRRSEFRTTALPQWRPIAYATWGNTSGSPGSAARNVTRTGPLAPRDRERCSSAKAARRVMRPTVRGGTRGLQTVRRWRPLSRRDFKMARPARVDMRLRNPWVRARFRVFG